VICQYLHARVFFALNLDACLSACAPLQPSTRDRVSCQPWIHKPYLPCRVTWQMPSSLNTVLSNAWEQQGAKFLHLPKVKQNVLGCFRTSICTVAFSLMPAVNPPCKRARSIAQPSNLCRCPLAKIALQGHGCSTVVGNSCHLFHVQQGASVS